MTRRRPVVQLSRECICRFEKIAVNVEWLVPTYIRLYIIIYAHTRVYWNSTLLYRRVGFVLVHFSINGVFID